MALTLTALAQSESGKTSINPQLVLKIDGYDTVFGAVDVLAYTQIGDDLTIGDDWIIGGLSVLSNQDDLISIEGTSNTINQQLRPDLGSVSSVSSVQVALIDVANAITALISPGVTLTDILGRKARLYMGFQNTSYPEDYVTIFAGIVDDILSEPGKITLNLAHPDQKKRQQLFQKTETEIGNTHTVTISIASPGVVSWTAHGLAADQPVSFTTTGALPTGLAPGTIYYARNVAANTFEVSATAGGSSINTSGTQSGVHTVSAGMNASQTSNLPLLALKALLTPVVGPDGAADTAITHYVRIDDELIKYTGVTGTATLTGIARAQLGTTAAAHEPGAKATSFYVLGDDLCTLALKLMLSGVNGYSATGVEVESIGSAEGLAVANGIYFAGVNVAVEYGITAGDYVTIAGATNGGNNVTLKPISSVTLTDSGSYVVITGATLIGEVASPATVSFRSRYDTLGEGFAMTPDEVDVDEHEYWRDLILSTADYRFYLKDTMDGKDFLEKQIYAPYGAYSLPRGGRASMAYHIGPIPRGDIVTLDRDNIKSPGKIKLRRTINRNFYNTITYAYDEDALEDKFLSGTVYQDSDSKSRIPVGNRVLSFDAKGIRTDLTATALTDQASSRMLNRYKFGAEFFENVSVLFKAGFTVEPGDLVLLNPDQLKISNTVSGDRDKPAKFFQVENKSLDTKTGDTTLSLVDTNYDLSERYGIISPSSLIASGTANYAYIQDSFGEIFTDDEPRKWASYVGETVLIHSEDFSFSEEVVFTGFDPNDPYKMLFETALSAPVAAGYIVDVPSYPTSTNPADNRIYKLYHAFQAPDVTVTAGVSATRFTVGAGDIAKFQVGLPVRVHSTDFVTDSGEVKVDSISGNDVIVATALGFTPSAGHVASFIGFADGDQPYRYL
jgi:hypothetical protein